MKKLMNFYLCKFSKYDLRMIRVLLLYIKTNLGIHDLNDMQSLELWGPPNSFPLI